MSLSDAIAKLTEFGSNKMYTVLFIKRSQNAVREIVCRPLTEVPKDPYKFLDNNSRLCRVFDVERSEVRSIPYEGILALAQQEQGEWVKVEGDYAR